MENQSTTNSPDTSFVNTTPVNQPSASPQTKTNLITPVLLTLVVSGIVFGFAGYYLGVQTTANRNTPNTTQTNIQISPTPISTATSNVNTDLVTFTGTVIPVTFSHSNKLKVYERTRSDQGAGLDVVYDYPDNPPRFLHIDTSLPDYFEDLKKLKVGEKYQDKDITEVNIIATRLPDVSISGTKALAYEWNELWEIPGPVREYYIPFKNSYIRVRFTYSNVVPSNNNDPMSTFDYVKGFDEIVSTFKISN